MSKIRYAINLSADGYFEGPDADLSWHQVDDELHTHFNEQLAAASAFLDGRITYELMAEFWPTADVQVDGEPDVEPAVAEFARIWRDMPKVVYSSTLQHADWNTTIVREVVADEVTALAQRSHGDLVIGGSILLETFRRLDLVDEYWIYVHPVILGAGRPLLVPGLGPAQPLSLVATRRFGNGVVLLHYARDRRSQPTPPDAG